MDKDEMIKEAQALSAACAELEATNPAAWKARQKFDAAAQILQDEWPEATPAQ